MDFHTNTFVAPEVEPGTVPQSEQISADQVRNNAGGFAWKVDDVTRLKRFLCLGCEGGTYYSSERKLTAESAQCINRLIKEGRGLEVVEVVKLYSVEGRTAKQTPILFSLAICARCEDLATKREAYKSLAAICRIPTFLFQFIEQCEGMKETTGWGRAHRNAVSHWYNGHADNPLKLAMHVTKYRNRNNWTHQDVLRLSHTKPVNDAVGVVLRYVTKGLDEAKKMYEKDDLLQESTVKKVIHFLTVVEEARKCTDETEMVEFIQKNGLVREHVPTPLLSSAAVWSELLKKMPMTAMIRNLAKMTSIGVLADGNQGEQTVVKNLSDPDMLKKARIHPFNVLLALKIYQQGRGDKGKLTWSPTKRILKALDEAYYMAFKFVEPTQKRYLLAVDVSGSMGCSVMNSQITCRDAAAAMMMTTRRTESTCEVVGFCHNLKPLDISAKDSLTGVIGKISNMSFGGTDCALPMIWAKSKKKMFDVFIVYTDCETWFGNIHPTEALREYRKWSGLWDARLIVCGMATNDFTIADPDDPGMLDVTGFDSNAPEAMRSFVMGEI